MTTNQGNGDGLGGPREVRVGDSERNAALTALGEHLASGRLDMDEYGTRSAQVTAARTAGDLQALFIDLPGPHPGVIEPTTRGYAQPLVQPGQPGQPAGGQRSRAQQIAAGLTGVIGLIAVVLFFLLNGHWDQAWLVFLLIPLSYGIASAVWGPDWKRDRRRSR